ncbi:hypothetical protein Tco_0167426, partial [Tanacetum coccineum]
MIHALKAELHSLSLSTDRDALRWGLIYDGSFTFGATSNGGETNDHIFYLCDVPSNIWRMVHVWIDLDIPSLNCHSDWEYWFDNIQ